MTVRLRHLANNEVQTSNDSTYSLRLPVTGFLHALFVRVAADNGATGGRNVGPLDIADEIRVVGDGDERFFTLWPRELEKWYETLMGNPLVMLQTEVASAEQFVVLPLLFGRSYYDPNFFLPLGRIKNPRLEIPYSPAIAADGGFTTGTTDFNVLALWSPETDRLNYQGTLITRTVEDFDSAASGDNVTDIDITDPIRAVGIYAYEAGVEDGTDITRVRLEANSGEYDIFAGDWFDLLEYDKMLFWSRIVHNFRLFAQNNDTIDTRLGRIRQYSIELNENSEIAADQSLQYTIDAIAGDRMTFAGSLLDIVAGSEEVAADATDRDIYLSVEGDSPSYFGLIPFMMIDEPNFYLNPKEFDKLRLILTQGGAGADVRVSLQFLKNLT
jgi:hypothetical protein